MTLNVPRIRHYLQTFALEKMFIEELGWDRHSARLTVQADNQTYSLTAFAEKRGVQIFECLPDVEGNLPDYATRRKIEKQVTKLAYEHLIIFMNADKTVQIWQWVSRQPGHPAAYREHHYNPRHHSGDSLIQKLEAITFTLNEEEGLTLTGVVFRLHDAFDRDRVTKKFYDYFKKEHGKFLDFIQAITEQGDREWYASLMLNRLMFVYFIQRKGFLDGDVEYLKNRLKMVQERKGKDKFLTFYRYFLVRLFHEGFAQQPSQRTSDLEDLLGKVPYLDGGLFELHELEEKYPDIDAPDKAFERLFGFFDQYEWHLDTRPLRNDREINPDVLGYIFEKYINQKQMGAYYTKEDITGYISKNTIIPYLFDAAEKKCAIAFQPDSALWRLLRDDPDRYIYPAVRKGVVDNNGEVIPLPEEIEKGIKDISQRGGWNRPADPVYALPTEIWREHVARRQRCLDLREKLKAGEIHQINDLITYNLDIRQFVEDVITGSEGPELLRAFYKAISTITVLDPTCGSGAFLFAALNILEPLYEACLDRMQGFVDDLDRSGERHRPEKFSDFRNTLAEIERHPNRRYFILKSIIVNNLYGVDIMQEAVEICKLRLFLKLVSQVDKTKQLEPLPDIDFNVRAGNTLVGFTSLDEVKESMEGNWIKLAELPRIQEEAEIVERAFNKFHEMQTAYGMNAEDFTEAKKELRNRLKKLEDQLDCYLARVYNVDPDREKEFKQWRETHRPYHWLVEFYGIMRRGGFNVVVGNPPWVEYKNVREEYRIILYSTQKCGNLYAYVIERCFAITHRSSRIGMILQLSAICTDRMAPLQKLFLDRSQLMWASCYDDRPAKLFDGLEHVRAVIALNIQGKTSKPIVFNTNLQRWHTEARPFLFPRLEYGEVSEMRMSGSLPKAGDSTLKSIIEKLRGLQETLEKTYNPRSIKVVYYYRSPLYWIRSMDFMPFFRSAKARRSVHHFKNFPLTNESLAPVVGCIINSTLFYAWFIVYGNGRNVAIRDIVSFPAPKELFCSKAVADLSARFHMLMESYKSHSVHKIRRDGVEYEEFYPSKSKIEMDKIDCILAEYYDFTDEELDYIINYDIKYRMG